MLLLPSWPVSILMTMVQLIAMRTLAAHIPVMMLNEEIYQMQMLGIWHTSFEIVLLKKQMGLVIMCQMSLDRSGVYRYCMILATLTISGTIVCNAMISSL